MADTQIKNIWGDLKADKPLLIAIVVVGVFTVYLIYRQNNSASNTPNTQSNQQSPYYIAQVDSQPINIIVPSTQSTTTSQSGAIGSVAHEHVAPNPIQTPSSNPVPSVQQPQQARIQVVGHWPDWNGSLWGIAQHYYGDGNQDMKIAQANGISNPNLIYAGQRLIIP